ncbi:MAG TPA: 30S ribosomal protein S20 [Candidatus Saccharimonadales bacterium]|nr:30S ribosomal protein S20 [Candidatus Saccharimonadales bacterium]
MPIIRSAKKRVRVAHKAAVRNSKTKRSLRTALKSFQSSVTGGKKDATTEHRKAQSALDKAGKKNVMHKNKVARKKRQLSMAAKAAGSATHRTTVKKATLKKPTAAKKVSKVKKS